MAPAAEARLPEGIERIELPMTGNPLGYVNAYLLREPDGYALIDCGWDVPDVLAALEAGLARYGVQLEEIRDVIVTHFHPDHYGLAGRLVRTVGARLMMHDIDARVAYDRLSDFTITFRENAQWFARNGYATGNDGSIKDEPARYSVVAPQRALNDGDEVPLAKGSLRVLWTPGHSPGHICLLDTTNSVLFSGDHILDPITPHVGTWSGQDDQDQLGAFLASLRKVRATRAGIVAPAHGRPFNDVTRRVDELLAHHDERELLVREALGSGPSSAGTIAAKLPWTRRHRTFAELGGFHQAFAVAETIAHLEHLRARNMVTRNERDGVLLYESGSE
ncbi:MBL fold metallo-hydrolase [bacterium]|nr:MAG: MBL fold metallo-hydrolase [bacterium]